MPHFDLVELLRTVGYVGLFLIVFTESGLFFGFFLPGDSLLFTAGFLASTGLFSLPIVIVLCVVAAIAGVSVGYAFGRRVGRPLFNRPNSRWFKQEHLLKAEAFYEKHGAKTLVLARFLPVVRTFAPIVAGVANMRYSTYITYNIIGGLLWGIGMPLGGYLLGAMIPDPDRYLLPVIFVIIVVSILPTAIHVWRERRAA